METLGSIAKVVRSKNAGALYFTLDIMFAEDREYQRVKDSGVITHELIGELYGLSSNAVDVIYYDVAYAIKITIPRDVPSGDPGDTDVYGAQQHAPLLAIEIP